MVPQGLDPVDTQYFGDFFHLLTAQAIDDTALADIGLGVTHDLLQCIFLGANLIEQVLTVEGGFEQPGVFHAQVFLNVCLDFWRSRRRKGDDGHLGNLIDDGADAPVFRTEIMAPFGNAVGLVHRHKTDAYAAQEVDVVLLGKALRGDVQQLGQTGADILSDLSCLCFR